MHLDVARHFFDKQFVKRYVDYVAAYKINTLHLYLTDDQGWRLEIQRYPKLTETGAWRSGTWKHKVEGPGDDKRYGGYFTQDDIREIVRYAQDRFVTVVPGISMPGHSQAALAAYPNLSSTGGPFEVWTRWGISKEVMDPGKEDVFVFLEGVLGEAAELFPSPYLHVGGDEVPRDRWRESPYAQARIKKEGLKDEDELQSYFTKRVQRLLQSNGKRLIGWEEILLGGAPPNATVMSWRCRHAELAAVRAGLDVIMVPHEQVYFNYRPIADPASPGHSRVLPLRSVYEFEPVPAELSPEEARHILGAQACLWTEFVPTPEDAEYLLFPRICALAEVVWSPKDLRRWDDFQRRVRDVLPRLDRLGVRYGVDKDL
jgi:hexosaminidase